MIFRYFSTNLTITISFLLKGLSLDKSSDLTDYGNKIFNFEELRSDSSKKNINTSEVLLQTFYRSKVRAENYCKNWKIKNSD